MELITGSHRIAIFVFINSLILTCRCSSFSRYEEEHKIQSNPTLPICCDFLTTFDGHQKCSHVAVTSQTHSETCTVWEPPPQILVTQNSNPHQKFTLTKHGELRCAKGSTTLQKIQLDFPTDQNESEFHIFLDGSLLFNQTYYGRNEYCVERITDTEIEVNICKAECDHKSAALCLPKCCPLSQVLENTRCSNSTREKLWAPILHENPVTQLSAEENAKFPVHFMHSNLIKKCDTNFVLFSSNPEETSPFSPYLRFRVLTNGQITFRDHTRTWVVISSDEFCVDGGAGASNVSTILQTCQSKFIFPTNHSSFQIYPILMLISSTFILVTIAVHILLWDKQNIHGWNTISQSVSMFFWFVFLGTASLLTEYRDDLLGTEICKWIGILAHYFFLTTFAWLTLISFDLFNTFRKISPSSTRSKGCIPFAIYSVIGWGFPLATVILAITLDFLYKIDEDSQIPLPEYGEHSCYIASYSQLYYAYAPVAILMVINISLFIYTSIRLYKYRQSTKMATKQMRSKQHSFELFAKLFFVMGVSWITEVISWAVSGGALTWYWFVFDLINIATPFAIFIIFVVKWDVLYQLEQKHPAMKPLIIPMVYLLQLIRCKRPDHVMEEFTSLKTNETSISKSVSTSSERYSLK